MCSEVQGDLRGALRGAGRAEERLLERLHGEFRCELRADIIGCASMCLPKAGYHFYSTCNCNSQLVGFALPLTMLLTDVRYGTQEG